MRQLSKRLLVSAGSVLGFATMATALTLVVEYKPYGVPDERRAEYEDKVAEIRERARLLKQLDQTATPRAVVPVSSHDFGLMDPHATATHAFEIRNEGEHPLALDIKKTSCKCTVGSLESGLLQPGETTTVTMTWNTGYEEDEYQQTATVVTNDPRAKTIELTVKGQVRAELVMPKELAFRISDLAEATQASFVVYSQVWTDFEVIDAMSDLQGFEWYAEPIDCSSALLHGTEARSAWKVTIMAASEEYGEFSGELTLTIQPSDGGARGDVSRELAVLDVKPDELQASLEPLSQPGSYRLTIKIPADCPFVLFNGDHQHGYVQVGDPEDPRFSNWFPLYGAVVTVGQ